ncbi:hypothetical protein BDV29DRAFT_189607 [Aspergillus leporis]|uniref:Uncharacterized protein n=1 Tax=Aspergillus leporis TaxID=41062 RepID=A0A5N5XAC3_9EURO|nr:hypothetical protein BDV29DRAFT_189607 [Aspergillus leporis]
MLTSANDFKLVGLAAGFTLGFGFLTVWNAIKQTAAIEKAYKSFYVILVVLGWLVLEGVIPRIAPVLTVLLFCWVIEIQCLIIKWVITTLITSINIAVFCIWIPAHMNPPVNNTFVQINRYWDPISKGLICVVNIFLNMWFLRVIRALLIGLMILPNTMVYIQYHPVTYMVKLNIEIKLASLIHKLAKDSNISDMHETTMHLTSEFPPLGHFPNICVVTNPRPFFYNRPSHII